MHAAAVVNLSDVLDKRISAFSGGMKQRVLIAQAVLGDPQIIILDEPTAGLDPKERIRIRNLISGIAMNRIVLIATHVVSDIECIAKRIIMLKSGNIIANATPGELLSSLQEMVYEIPATEDELITAQDNPQVSNIRRDENDQIWVRLVAAQKPDRSGCCIVPPTLEDVYLHTF